MGDTHSQCCERGPVCLQSVESICLEIKGAEREEGRWLTRATQDIGTVRSVVSGTDCVLDDQSLSS